MGPMRGGPCLFCHRTKTSGPCLQPGLLEGMMLPVPLGGDLECEFQTPLSYEHLSLQEENTSWQWSGHMSQTMPEEDSVHMVCG